MLNYPVILDEIFSAFHKKGANAIIVGGYVRDALLNIASKDIDIEVYGLASADALESILKEFGKVNSVGKSFGVCKLKFQGLDLDFSLPREDSKIASGHRGFEIKVNPNLTFKQASSRRDFTINAIGYDTLAKKILDPFYGKEDLQNKILKTVDAKKFTQDPLRVLRAVQFYARFELSIESNLLLLCKRMIKEKLLDELPKDRVFTEFKKLLLKSAQPSLGFSLLQKIDALSFFTPLQTIASKSFDTILTSLDALSKVKTSNDKIDLILMFSVLCSEFTQEQTITFISKITDEKELLKQVLLLNTPSFKVSYSDVELYKLAVKVNIELFLILHSVVHKELDAEIFKDLKDRAIRLNILNTKMKPFLQGRDLIEMGLQASKEFSKILDAAYDAQVNLEIKNYEEARAWLDKYLLP